MIIGRCVRISKSLVSKSVDILNEGLDLLSHCALSNGVIVAPTACEFVAGERFLQYGD
jgi:hypothetical protein